MLGVSQRTSDNRDIEEGVKVGGKRCQLVENMLFHQLTKYVGGFAAAMGGLDAVVFTGGIGENSPRIRSFVGHKLEFMGCRVDDEKNNCRGKEVDFATPDSKIRLLVIPTEEELTIAKDTYEIVTALNK